MFSLYIQNVILFRLNWREVAVEVLLNMLRRVERDAGLAPALTWMCRRRRPSVLVLKVSFIIKT